MSARLARAAARALLAYHRVLSPLLPAACRFEPTCSAYAADALLLHGLGRGSRLALGRLLRCNPLFEGGDDPVPLEAAHG